MLNGELKELFLKYPLRRLHERERVLTGDLQYAAQRYAHHAAGQGSAPGPWQVWIRIQEVLGLNFEQALGQLSTEQLHWLSQSLFGANQSEFGVEAYRRYLEVTECPLWQGNVLYLRHLLKLGRGQAAIEAVALVQERFYDAVFENIFLAMHLLDEEPERNLDRLRPFLRRYHDCGDLWAAQALMLARCGRLEEARVALGECETQICDDEQLLSSATAACGIEIRSGGPQVVESRGQTWTLRPSPGGPHRYGGQPIFEMPACAGCGHPIRQWFCLELGVLPEIRKLLPGWTKFPLLSCVDCIVWMGRHDYRLAGDEVVLSNLCFDAREARRTHVDSPDEPLEAQQVDVFSDFDRERWDEPLVGGPVPWVQERVGVPCLECRQPMVYVAAMTTPARFNDVPFINNGSGYQFHFACDGCKTLSVIAQWT